MVNSEELIGTTISDAMYEVVITGFDCTYCINYRARRS